MKEVGVEKREEERMTRVAAGVGGECDGKQGEVNSMLKERCKYNAHEKLQRPCPARKEGKEEGKELVI